MSGAMVLNTMLKHLPQHRDEAEQRLREAIRVPANDDEARAKIRALMSWLGELTEAGVITRRQIQASRIPTFLSTLWYVRDAEHWPAYYESMRDRLADLGAFTRDADAAESYLRFKEAVVTLRGELNLSPWDLERLCRYDVAKPSKPPPGPPAKLQRVWLWHAGRQGVAWPDFKGGSFAGISLKGASPSTMRWPHGRSSTTSMSAMSCTPRSDSRELWGAAS